MTPVAISLFQPNFRENSLLDQIGGEFTSLIPEDVVGISDSESETARLYKF